MIRVLVPIEAYAHLTLAATYFALEFAKRHPAKVFFLLLAEAAAAGGKASGAAPERLPASAVFQQLLQRARQQQVEVEVNSSQEEYLTAIQQEVARLGIDDLVIALPPVGDPDYLRLHRRLEQLRHQVPCHIITVKPKEVSPTGMGGRSPKRQA